VQWRSLVCGFSPCPLAAASALGAAAFVAMHLAADLLTRATLPLDESDMIPLLHVRST
jgi:hypothetical protein